MHSTDWLRELHEDWFPHMTDDGIRRLIALLENNSPYLVSGCFSKATPMGCLATQIAWHHPSTSSMTQDAGVIWLTRVARLNPATSCVIREWDSRGPRDWDLRSELLTALRAEDERRVSVESLETELQLA
jgi:hypothetical protein